MPPHVKAAIRREETLMRYGGDGLCRVLAWTADDRQLLGVADGCGWPENPMGMVRRYRTSNLYWLGGDPTNATIRQIPGYPEIPMSRLIEDKSPYYGDLIFGASALAVDGCIYQFLATGRAWNPLAHPNERGSHFVDGMKLIYSPDNGETWHNQDGSTPVVLETRKQHSLDTLMWFEEPTGVMFGPFVQMGQDYRDNRDGYVYLSAPNGRTASTQNQLVMCRVPKVRICVREAYEFFAGLRPNGEAVWAENVEDRGIVHTFPEGWSTHPVELSAAWNPDITYNAPLGIYMMHATHDLGRKGGWGAPYLGIWIAANPWGPWQQIYEEEYFTVLGNPESIPFGIGVVPKWTSQDGESYWVSFAELTNIAGTPQDLANYEAFYRQQTPEELWWQRFRWRQHTPYFGFNAQRIDLVTS
jgi:hypothetical protein